LKCCKSLRVRSFAWTGSELNAAIRYLRQATTLIKVVGTIGLSVSIPPISELLFGQPVILSSPGFVSQPHTYTILGTPITSNQLISYACVVIVLVAGTFVLRRTSAGLTVRAMVDSEAMTSISGTNPSGVAVGVWGASTFLAGLAGVLAAPVFNLDNPENYVLLAAAAFAAVVAARLRSLPIAVTVGILMGIVGALVQWILPPTSEWAQAVVPSIPFAFVVVFLLFYTIRGGRLSDSNVIGGTLDRAIRPQGRVGLNPNGVYATGRVGQKAGWQTFTAIPGFLLAKAPFLILAVILPFIVHGYLVGLVAEAMAFAICFLSYTVMTGEGGLISLCQITFAGVGAVTTGQLAGSHGWPVLLAVVVGGMVAAVLGFIVSLLTLRMGNLYLALVTLTFGLLMDQLVFNLNVFTQSGVGVTVLPPSFAHSDRALSYLTIACFVVVASVVYLVRRSTMGLALSAMRSSDVGARSLGLSVVSLKLFASSCAALIAGIGGGLLAVQAGVALPGSYATLGGLVWLAVLVTVGARSNNAAILAGLSFVFLPVIVSDNLPTSWGPVPIALFGFGAIMVAKNPDGIVAMHSRQLHGLLQWARRRDKTIDDPAPIPLDVGGESIA
jgi:branched-chain amino acid transport system permease protein